MCEQYLFSGGARASNVDDSNSYISVMYEPVHACCTCRISDCFALFIAPHYLLGPTTRTKPGREI